MSESNLSRMSTTAKTTAIAIAKRQSRSLPLGILMVLFVCSAAHAVNVQFKLSNFGFDPNAIQAVRLLPTNSTPTVQSNRIIINSSITKFTDTNGNVTFTNVFGGSYLVFVSATNVGGGVASPTIFRITGLPTNSTSTVDASDYISVAVPSDIARYLAAGTNIVFVTNSGTLTIHGTVVSSSGGGSIAVYSNNAAVSATNVVRLESTNSGNVSFNWTSNATGVARFSADVNSSVTNGLNSRATSLESQTNSLGARSTSLESQTNSLGARATTLEGRFEYDEGTDTLFVTNSFTPSGIAIGPTFSVSKPFFADTHTANRVAIWDGNKFLTNTATVTPAMLEGFSPADIWLTNWANAISNLTATMLATNNGTAFNPTFRSNSASAGVALSSLGNVGIGTTTPTAWLDISNAPGTTGKNLFHAGTNTAHGLTVDTNGQVKVVQTWPNSSANIAVEVNTTNANSAGSSARHLSLRSNGTEVFGVQAGTQNGYLVSLSGAQFGGMVFVTGLQVANGQPVQFSDGSAYSAGAYSGGSAFLKLSNNVVIPGTVFPTNGVVYKSNALSVAQVTALITNGDCWVGMLSNRLHAVCMSNNAVTFTATAPVP